MQRLVFSFVIALLATGSLCAKDAVKPVLRVSCVADRGSYAASDAVRLTVTLENVGPSDLYIYKNVEWGWAGIGFSFLNAKGEMVRAKRPSIPLPPPPVYDKSQFVSLARGYFYGTHLDFDLTHYALEPGVYSIEISYRSNYREDSGFGLPILTFADGEFVSNRVQIEVHSK